MLIDQVLNSWQTEFLLKFYRISKITTRKNLLIEWIILHQLLFSLVIFQDQKCNTLLFSKIHKNCNYMTKYCMKTMVKIEIYNKSRAYTENQISPNKITHQKIRPKTNSNSIFSIWTSNPEEQTISKFTKCPWPIWVSDQSFFLSSYASPHLQCFKMTKTFWIPYFFPYTRRTKNNKRWRIVSKAFLRKRFNLLIQTRKKCFLKLKRGAN